MEFYSAIKKNEITSFTKKQMQLEILYRGKLERQICLFISESRFYRETHKTIYIYTIYTYMV